MSKQLNDKKVVTIVKKAIESVGATSIKEIWVKNGKCKKKNLLEG